MTKFINKIKYVKLKDFFALLEMIVALPLVFFFKIILKLKEKELWLVCEDEFEARDNGYEFFKYVRENYPGRNVRYAINKKSPDYLKVKKIGKTVNYGHVMHWVYYLSSSINISSQKGGKPNAAVCYILEVYGILKNKRVFLQHGITLNDAKWLYYENTKIRLFISGAYPEYEFLSKKFGYPKKNLKYLGLCRYDKLHDVQPNKNEILLMPTWRKWISNPTKESYKYDNVEDFKNTEYFKKFNSLINNSKLVKFLEDKSIILYFYPHRNMQKFIHFFSTKSDNVIIADSRNYEIQDILKRSSLMITDYSSVSLDFAYMKKPIIFYQFDSEKFHQAQYTKGYFRYDSNGFGSKYERESEVIEKIIDYQKSDYKLSEEFISSHGDFFKLYDKNNCKRIYNEILKID